MSEKIDSRLYPVTEAVMKLAKQIERDGWQRGMLEAAEMMPCFNMPKPEVRCNVCGYCSMRLQIERRANG